MLRLNDYEMDKALLKASRDCFRSVTDPAASVARTSTVNHRQRRFALIAVQTKLATRHHGHHEKMSPTTRIGERFVDSSAQFPIGLGDVNPAPRSGRDFHTAVVPAHDGRDTNRFFHL
jgi:hypothetical protein